MLKINFSNNDNNNNIKKNYKNNKNNNNNKNNKNNKNKKNNKYRCRNKQRLSSYNSFHNKIDRITEKPFTLSRASIGQIMITINKICISKPNKVPYEVILNNFFNKEIPKLVFEYEKCLRGINDIDTDIRLFNLVKAYLPKHIKIIPERNGYNRKKEELDMPLETANLGSLIGALKQRISHIVNADAPPIYELDEEKNSFEYMKQDLSLFFEELGNFERKFVITVDRATRKQKEQHNENRYDLFLHNNQ